MIYRVLLVYLVFFTSYLSALDYEWSASISKKTALVNEAVYLKYVCSFNQDEELYTIDFSPAISTDKYDLVLLKESRNSYEFVLFVKQAGDLEFSFDTVMKKTTLDSIAEMTGGLDNEKAKDGFVSEYIKQKKLSLHVEPSNTKLIGDFSLNIKKDETKIKAFSPYHFEVIIEGIGNIEDLNALILDIKNVKTFTKKPSVKMTLTKNGYSGVWSQKFALVSENSFEIPKFSIKYYDLKSKSIKELNSKKVNIEVSPGYQKEKLLDMEEKQSVFNYKYLFFILALIFGFGVGKIKFKKAKVLNKKEILFNEKVQKTKSLDEFLILLILQNNSKYLNIISQIEQEKITSLKEAKKLV